MPVAVPAELAAGRIASAALDDRAGVYAALEALRRLAADPPAWDVAFVATTQEEGQAFGSRAVADRLRPDVAVVVEVTYATDASGPDPVEWGRHDLGDGPADLPGPVVSPIVTDGLLDVAASEGIAFTVETGRFTSSDTDEIVRRRRRHPQRDGLDPAPLDAHRERGRRPGGRGRHLAPARGVRPIARARHLVPAVSPTARRRSDVGRRSCGLYEALADQ